MGKIAHSSVPRKKALRPLIVNWVPRVPISRRPKPTDRPPDASPSIVAVRRWSAGWNSSQRGASAPSRDLLGEVPPCSVQETGRRRRAPARGLPWRGNRELSTPSPRPAGRVADPPLDRHRPSGDVREDLEVGHPDRRGRRQLDPPGDPVPVPLGVVADAVRVDADVDHQVVINADRQPVPAGNDGRAQVVLVGRGQAVPLADRPLVEPDSGLDVGPLEGEDQPTASPGRRDLDVALIPRRADVVLHRLEPERHLELPGSRYFAYSGAVNHDRSTIWPVQRRARPRPRRRTPAPASSRGA